MSSMSVVLTRSAENGFLLINFLYTIMIERLGMSGLMLHGFAWGMIQPTKNVTQNRRLI